MKVNKAIDEIMYSEINKSQFMQFLTNGALVQSGTDSFILFLNELEASATKKLHFYNTSFWDFTGESSDPSFDRQYSAYFELNRKQFIEQLLNAQKSADFGDSVVIDWQKPQNKAFVQQFDWIQNKIKHGQLIKGLPLILQTGQATSQFNLPNTLLTFLNKNLPTVFLYGSWEGSSGFLGATPEVLFRLENNEIQTMALAGTWSKVNPEVIDFDDAKTVNEHQIVVDDIQNQMKKFELLFQSPTHVKELKHLFHLETNFKYAYNGLPLKEIVSSLHPTAALGLYPRRLELFTQFQQLELQNQRGNFGAPIGFYNEHRAFMLVGIRNFYWHNNEFKIFSGCGVTKDSQVQAELDELEYKRNSVKEMFGFNL